MNPSRLHQSGGLDTIESDEDNEKHQLRQQLNAVREALAEIVRENYEAVQRECYDEVVKHEPPLVP